MATATTTTKSHISQGPDRNLLDVQRVRNVGDGLVRVSDNITEGSTVTLWAADNGLPTFDHGWFQVDPFEFRSDGASDSELVLELSGATQTVALRAILEVPMVIPGKIAANVSGTLEDVTKIQVKNPNGVGVGDIRAGLLLYGRGS